MNTVPATDSTLRLTSLDRISIALPCRMDWELMDGDDRVRFCDKCHKNVYNLSSMSETEATTLIQSSGDRICGRIFRRADGTVVTNMCPPPARQTGRRRLQFSIAGLVLLITASAGLCASAPWIGKKIQPLVDRFSNRNAPVTTVTRAMMGEVAYAPSPITQPVPPKAMMGKVAPLPIEETPEN